MSFFLAWPFWAQLLTLLFGYHALRFGLALSALYLARRTEFGRIHRVYAEMEPPGQILDEIWHTIAISVFDAIFLTVLIRSGLANLQPVVPWAVLLVVPAAILANEFSFYAFHRALHTPRLYFLHAQHHTARVSDPFTSYSFSVAEHVTILPPSALFVAALSWVVPVSVETMIAVAVTSELLACYGHMNVEIWRRGFPSTFVGQWLMTPTFHGMHHARFNGNYGLFTRIPDRLFGTEWADYPALHARVADGAPLPSLGTRADGATGA